MYLGLPWSIAFTSSTRTSARAGHAHWSHCRCERAVSELERTPPGQRVVHLLDEISDAVCHAADAAKFCAATHSSVAWRSAAQTASHEMQSYIAQLNTQQLLCDKLAATMEKSSVLSDAQKQAAGWTREEEIVGADLLREFKQAGMGQDPRVHAEYRRLTEFELHLCARLAHFEVCLRV